MITIQVKENPNTGANEAYVGDSLIGFFEQMDPMESTWSFMQKFPNSKMTGDHYIAIGNKLNELNAQANEGELKIVVDAKKIGSLTKVGENEKRFFHEQEDGKGKRLEFCLHQTKHSGKIYIGVTCIAYKDYKKVAESFLGRHKRNKNGVETIISSCQTYSFDRMFDFVMS